MIHSIYSPSRWRLAVAAFALILPAVALAPVAAPGTATPSGDIELFSAGDWASSEAGISLTQALDTIGVEEYWDQGHLGSGVDVAIIDSGVLPVPGLDGPGKVINGPDLSFESQADNLRYLDTFGHGTHLAGIIAGNDPGQFMGVAPEARLVNIKVADSQGAADVSQVIAAIDWVVQHRTDNGMNIRVLNLAFGTDGLQPHEIDPLHFAVEQAWQAGIVVVVSAGNDGNGTVLRNPAADPYVIAVGASDTNGTSSHEDDTVAAFSNCGTSQRHVDVVAPGKSLISLRAPGSAADSKYPGARVGSELFKGTGTSQAAAMISGAAALVLDANPSFTPDEVKGLLMNTAKQISASSLCQGAGSIDLTAAFGEPAPRRSNQSHPTSDGTGSIDAARGSHRVVDSGIAISGEVDIMGNTFNGTSWSQAAAAGLSWSGGMWNGTSWSGTSWSGTSWSGTSWSGTSWSGTSWSGTSWSGTSWSGTSWSGTSWSGTSWSGTSWSGDVWLGLRWD